ncbi:MAG: 4Fe-4S binding protein [Clostridia bacterium]|nr:4Fe-4S binding protein [Clostridia bacterium]
MKYLDVATLKFNQEKCIGCKKCLEVCPHQVFILKNKIEMAHKALCIECGACQMNCPVDAISVDAGTGCATAVLYTYLKKYKFLRRFLKGTC